MKLLLVEDEVLQIKYEMLFLKKIKHVEIITAVNAFDAYAILRAVPKIDLMMLDNDMPYVRGATFQQFLRNETCFAELPILFSTADDVDVSDIPYCSYLKKPYRPENLVGKILDILGLQNLQAAGTTS